jgi:hypothetical protein
MEESKGRREEKAVNRFVIAEPLRMQKVWLANQVHVPAEEAIDEQVLDGLKAIYLD